MASAFKPPEERSTLTAKRGQLLCAPLVMTDLYLAVRSDCPGVLKVAASENAYCSCGAPQAGHCFTVRPVAIFCYVGEYVSLVHAALETKRLAGDWFALPFKEACDAVRTVLAEELAHAFRDDSGDDVPIPMICHAGEGRID